MAGVSVGAGGRGSALKLPVVRRLILYRWPVQGWVQGRVFRVSRAAGFSHGVSYARGSALGAVPVEPDSEAARASPSLLDRAGPRRTAPGDRARGSVGDRMPLCPA